MLLSPRKTKYKTTFKKRSLNLSNYKLNFKMCNKLQYGQVGLKNINYNFLLYNKYLIKLKIFLKKSVRRSNITNRSLWLNIFPNVPITKKIIGSRMGKGKGKLSNWAAVVSNESILLEIKNARTGRSKYFAKQVLYKLPGKFKIVYRYNHNNLKLISFRNTTIKYNYFHN